VLQESAEGETAAYKEKIMDNEELTAHLDSSALSGRQLLEKYKILLDSIEKETKELEEIQKKYGFRERSTFNFFEPLKKYWHEIFHEIILSQILNPRTKEIGNIAYLDVFTDLLHSIKEDYNQNIRFDKDVAVETEIGNNDYGYIDILISDKRRAIIIESKINGAVDQENQLARYYQYVTGVLKKEVLAVVYLRPFGDENKMPPFEYYSDEYNEEVERIKKLLIPVPVAAANRLDLCHGFLDICYGIARNDMAKIYIKQYSDLLKTLGGNKMTLNIEKKLFKKLFENADSARKTADIGEVWEKRWLILASLIHDALEEEQDFELESEGCSYKVIAEGVNLIFVYEPYNRSIGNNYAIGFSFEPSVSVSLETKKALGGILAGIDSAKINLGKDVESIEQLLIRRVCLTVDKPAGEMISAILDIYTQLEEKAKSANITL
jgi:hypothetical protein